jgi:uncharacterized membrane protein
MAMAATNPPMLLDLVLRPHRSLSRAGFHALMAVLMAFVALGGLIFWLAGAWPVLGFLGLDVLLVYVALRLSFATGRAYERIRLSRDALTIERVDHWGRRREVALQPHWLRVDVDETPSRLRLTSRGRSESVAAFLPPEELDDVAGVLRAALARLREPTAPA